MLAIGILNSKGGVGKTLLATVLAVRATKDFPRVAIVDLDPQQGSSRWWGHRGSPDNPTVLFGETVASDAMEALHQTGWDFVIFDGAPGALELTEDAIRSVDLVVIPMKASDQDLGGAESAVSACVDFKSAYLCVLNEATSPTDRRALEVREVLMSAGHPVAQTIVCRRVPYVDASNSGRSAAEIKSGKAAEAEIDRLYAEIMKAAKAAAKRRRARV